MKVQVLVLLLVVVVAGPFVTSARSAAIDPAEESAVSAGAGRLIRFGRIPPRDPYYKTFPSCQNQLSSCF